MVGETGGKKKQLRLQTKPEYVRTRFKKGVDVKHGTNLFQLFICTKLKKLRSERLPTCPEKALKKA